MLKKRYLKICFIGIGSIGKRHLLNITELLKREKIEFQVDCLKHRKNSVDKEIDNFISHIYLNVDEMPNDYDIIFITNPTNLHFETLKKVSCKAINFFIEKPVFHSSACNSNDIKTTKEKTYYIACPLRHTNILKKIKEISLSEKIYSIRAISSSYLPDWRKSIDYRTSYSADIELGGGVSLDLIHEWDYIISIFGFPEHVFNMKDKVSNLEITSDDISVYIAKYKDKLVEVHLDYFGRIPIRKLEIYCENYVIYADIMNSTITYSGEKEDLIKVEKTDMYKAEMEYFLKLIDGECENINDLCHAEEVLTVALGGYR